MANRRRRPRVTFRRFPSRRRERRIVIPQSVERPIKLNQRDLVKRTFLRSKIDGFVEHRRGVRQLKVGEDPMEARAVPDALITGTLPERIVYKYLRDYLHLIPGLDFDFQSSLQGGRMELGGIVADFLLEIHRFVLQVQGPTHGQFLRGAKDDEQELALADMGYVVFYLDLPLIQDERRFERKMKRIFNISNGHHTGGDAGGGTGFVTEEDLAVVENARLNTNQFLNMVLVELTPLQEDVLNVR